MRQFRGPTVVLLFASAFGFVAAVSPVEPVSAQSTENESAQGENTNGSSGGSDASESEESEIDAFAELDRANRAAGQKNWEAAIGHFEKVIKAKPKRFPSAHFNLANILRAEEKYGRALFHFQVYRSLVTSSDEKESASEKIDGTVEEIGADEVGTLTVDIDPESRSTLSIDGFPVAWNSGLEGFKLKAGTYRIRGDVVDHHPAESTVIVEGGDSQKERLEPDMKTFYGHARVDVDQENATIKLHPEKVESPKAPTSPIVRTSPMEEPVELVTGKYLVEVTKPDFHRWVRYIQIKRDKTKKVRVEMSEKLPEEIR